MGSPECSWSYVKRDLEDNLDVRSDRAGDGHEREGADKRRHRSSKSRKPNSGDDGDWKRKGSGDRSGSRKRLGGQVESEDDDYESRKDSRAKIKKKAEVSSLEKLSNWYEDGDLESRPNGGDKSDSRVHAWAEESDKRRSTPKSDQEGFGTGSKSREGLFSDGELERRQDGDSRYLERWDSSRDKSRGSSDQVRNSRRRWDESDSVRKAEETPYERADMGNSRESDHKYESGKERNPSLRTEPVKSRNKGSESNIQRKSIKEEKKDDAERNKRKGKSEAVEEDWRDSPNIPEDTSTREKSEKQRHQKIPGSRDVADSREKSLSTDECNREKILIEARRQGSRSETPERIIRHQQDVENSEMEYDKGRDLKRKELDKEVTRDDRLNIKDDNWSDRSREREGCRENWKRRQRGSNDNDLKGGDVAYDCGREWEIQRHGRERIESERHHGRSGHRKDANRGEAVKTSSNFGISNDNYDVIEIQTRPFDHARPGSASNISRRSESGQQYDGKSLSNDDESAYAREDRVRRTDASGDEVKYRDIGDSSPLRDQSDCRGGNDVQGGKGFFEKGVVASHSAGGQTSNGPQPPYGNQDPGSLVRASQGVKGSRGGRGGRIRPMGRDNQQAGFPLPMMGSPFGPIGIPPPGPMQPLNPNMSPAPGPPISPGVFIPPFPPVVWPGGRGFDMNSLSVPPGLSPVPPGPSGPRFPANIGTPPNPTLYFNQSGPGRGMSPNTSAPNFSAPGPLGRGTPHDKSSGGWVAPRSSGSSGKAPFRGEQNDYSQNFVDTGLRPQNFIRELELTNVEDYPKLRELIQKKDEIVANSASPPMYFKCDLKDFDLSPEFFGTKFDVILVDPPWEEYVHRAPGVTDHIDYWTFEEIMNLKIEAIADTPSFIFLWVGDGVGLEQGRQCLKKWGFRRCEDICWVKTNKTNATPGLRHDSHTLFQHSKEHCLMGIKGTVRRSTDGHIIHANIDTDVIIAEEPPYGSTRKPEDMYRIIEHFALGRRRLELFGEEHNIRAGWLTIGKGLSSSNFNAEGYTKTFADKDGKVWQGGGGRNPPPEAPHLVLTTPDIEALRPKSPMKNQQQLQQQQSNTISLTGPGSSNRRASGTSPQNAPSFILNQEPMGGFKGRVGSSMPSEDKVIDMYGYSGQANVDFLDFESQRPLNL